MTPKEIQRTMDFIVRIQADSAIRTERWQEKFEKDLEKIKETIAETAKLARQNEASILAREKGWLRDIFIDVASTPPQLGRGIARHQFVHRI